MTIRETARNLMIGAGALALGACGGGGGTSTAFIPAPPVTPTPPAPPPPPPPPTPPDHLGLVSAEPFAVLAVGDTYKINADGSNLIALSVPGDVDVKFSYDVGTNNYRVTLPGFNPGTLADTSYNGTSGQPATSTFSKLKEDSSGSVMPVSIGLPVPGTSPSSPYSYTSFGYWSGRSSTTATGEQVISEGLFAYGIPTASGNVPITGSASYSANITGTVDAGAFFYLSGTADLQFNFGAGTLSGSMHPYYSDGWGDSSDFGKYDFKQTVYSSGSTTFSGKFDVPGLPNANSSFDGQFTGPGAAELMARFQAPYLQGDKQGTLSGIWIGKKN